MTRRIPPVRRLLMDARALIAKPECWCKRAFARSAQNRVTDVDSVHARKFCVDGALRRLHDENSVSDRARRILRRFAKPSLITFNDAPTTTHLMVMRLFNQAIRRAKEQGI